MTISVRRVARIADIDPTAWDALAAPELYLSRPWLTAMEGRLGEHHPYLLAERNGRLVGVLPCQLVERGDTYAFYNPQRLFGGPLHADLAGLLDGGERDALGRASAALADEPLLPALLATAPSGYRSGALLASGLDADAERAVCDALLSALEESALALDARVFGLLYVPEPAPDQLAAALVDHGFTRTVLAADSHLDLPAGGIDPYLDALPARRRRRVRADLRRFERAGCRVTVAGVEALGEGLARLQVAAQAKHGHELAVDRVMRDYKRIRDHLADQVLVFEAWRGSERLAFALFYRWAGALHARATGFDYERLGDEGAYFNVVYYAPVRVASDKGAARLELGMDAEEAKLLRGARLRDLGGYVRTTVAELSGPLARRLEVEAAARQRRHDELRERYGQVTTTPPRS
jgi:predicted N-acyltransferase